MKRLHPLRTFGLAPFLGVAAAAASPVVIPLIPGLTLIHAVSERQGDYESTLNVEDLDADGMLHLTTSAELPDSAGGATQIPRWRGAPATGGSNSPDSNQPLANCSSFFQEHL